MAETKPYRQFSDEEIRTLSAQGCSSDDWSSVAVAEPVDSTRLRGVHFSGKVQIGSLSGQVEIGDVAKPAGIYRAHIDNCTIGDGVRIANIGAHLANYAISDGACIEDVGSMQTSAGAGFGNGVEIEVLNEGGGRELTLFNEMSSQFAYLACLHRYRPMVSKLVEMASAAASTAQSDRGTVGSGASITSVKQIVDVNIGAHATVSAATRLCNGTVLSSEDAPTQVGADVQADDFIIAEGSEVSGGAIIAKTYVGQGCQIGKQFSAEGSVFFANCEGFHGEACSIFAGPYTVTHHKSTLLIAGLFSFYNAGSGTNQSNHMYKLGPVHEGKLERGTKTGSFAYMMWPCRVGPFSVVLGKHAGTFDTADYPFSLIEASPSGRCKMVPGLTLSTVGTVRDGAKWPTRDRRKGRVKRDRISFDVLSPLTVGRMIAGLARMKELHETTDRAEDTVTIGGAEVKRVLLRTCQKYYRAGIHMYLQEKVVARVEQARDESRSLGEALGDAPDAVYSEDWLDIGGQLIPRGRLDDLWAAIESGEIADVAGFEAKLDSIHDAYAEDEWAWVKRAYKTVFDAEVDGLDVGGLEAVADALLVTKGKFLKLILADAGKEFGDFAQSGFGQDGTPADAAEDFSVVRGTFDANKFVKQMQDDMAALQARVEQFKKPATSR